MNRTLFPFAAILFALVPASSLRSQALVLADGKVLLASVENLDGDGLRVKRLDNGGVLELRWDHLMPECAQRLKSQAGLTNVAEEEYLVAADHVTYEHDGRVNELIGKIVKTEGGIDTVQIKGQPFLVPLAEIRQHSRVNVPVAQIYTRDEFYTMHRDEVKPGDDADRHVQLAQDLIRVRDYDHAKEHLDKARELGNSKDPKRIDEWTDKLKRYQENANERLLLDQIQVSRVRGSASGATAMTEFDKGLKLIAQFEKDFPKTKLGTEFEAEKKRFADARTKYLTLQVAEVWKRDIDVIADKTSGEAGITIAKARDYAQGKMKDDIADKVAATLKLSVEEVKQYFQARAKYPQGMRPSFFAYGIGSWTLGDKAIKKDTTVGKSTDKTEKDPAQEREIERIAKMIRTAMEKRKSANQGQQGGQTEVTEDDWWKEATRAERGNFLAAFYAENCGDLVMAGASLTQCIACYGEGTHPEMGPDNKVIKAKCLLCHGTKWLRSFRAY